MDWFGLLAVEGTLKCLNQNYSSKAPSLHHSVFIMVQHSHPLGFPVTQLVKNLPIMWET